MLKLTLVALVLAARAAAGRGLRTVGHRLPLKLVDAAPPLLYLDAAFLPRRSHRPTLLSEATALWQHGLHAQTPRLKPRA